MGKTYVISDIHAHLAPLNKFLQSIEDNDIVYVLGDLVDKGPDGLEPFITILNDPRCILLLGNHELMMLEHLHENALNSECSNVWLNYNGGAYTMTAYRHLRKRDQKRILTAMEKAIIQTTVHVDGIDFIIVHAFPDQFKSNIYVSDLYDGKHYDWGSRYVWFRGEPVIDGKTVVVGHTPTPFANGWDRPASVIMGKGWINIDCGLAGNREGVSRLAALCLDDLTVRYFEM